MENYLSTSHSCLEISNAEIINEIKQIFPSQQQLDSLSGDKCICDCDTDKTADNTNTNNGDNVNNKFIPITVSEAICHFNNTQFPNLLSNGAADKRTFDLFRWLKSSPKLNDNLTGELQLIHNIMECRLDWDDNVQWRMLETIYMSFTDTNTPCPKKGTHWQKIGFQGNDPTTDLRRVGLFGVIQLLHLTSPDLFKFSKLLHCVSNSEKQPFPMAVLSLNATNITFNAIDSGKLVRECNARNSVIEVLNMFYVAVLVYILRIWIQEKKTIKDSGYLLKDAERYCCKNVKKVLKDLPSDLNRLLSLQTSISPQPL